MTEPSTPPQPPPLLDHSARSGRIEIAVLDQHGVIESINPAWARSSEGDGDRGASTGVGEDYLEACDRAAGRPGAADLAAAIRRALAGELVGPEIVEMVRHSHTEEHWFDALVSARNDEDGTITGATVVVTPATPHGASSTFAVDGARGVVDIRSNQASAPLSDISATDGAVAWAIVEASPDAVVMVDEDGLIELATGQAEKLFGYDRLELLGRPVEMLLPDRFGKAHTAHRTRFRIEPEIRAMGTGQDLVARRADGSEVPVEVSLSPVHIDGQLRVIAAVRDVSARLAGEIAARRIRVGFDSIRDGVFMFSPDGLEFSYVNEGAVEQSGYSDVELLDGMTPLHLAPEFTRAQFVELIRPLLDHNVASIDFETVQRAKNGDEFPVEVVMDCRPVEDDRDRVVVAVVRDISERRAAEHAAMIVQHSIDSVSDAVFVCDENTLEFVHANQGATDLHGYRHDELLAGMTPADLAPELPTEELNGLLEQLRDAPHDSGRVTTIGLCKNGDRRHVDVRINWPAPSSPTGPRPIVAVVRDVTAQVEAEQRQRASEVKFRAAFDDGPVPMTIVEVSPTADRVIVEANQAMADLLRYPIEELVGMSVTEFNHPDDLAEDDEATSNQLGGSDDTFTTRKRYICADDEVVWVDLHVRVLGRDGDTMFTIGNSIDVTAEVAAEKAKIRRDALNSSLSEIRLRMLQGASRAEALALVCTSTKDVLTATSVLVLTPTGVGTELQIEAAVGLSDTVRAALSFQSDRGVVGDVFTTGEPQFTGRGDTRIPEVNARIVESQSVESVLMAPLHSSSGIFGVLLVSRDNTHEPLDSDDLTLIEQFAAAAVSAVELAAARENKNRMSLFEDRERIGRDMHDNVIGRLFATGMTMQASAAHITEPAVKQRMNDAVDQIDQAIKDIRTTVFGLRSGLDWGRGNRGRLLEVAADQNATLGFEPSVDLHGPIDDLAPAIIDDLLATMREALTNIVKYAEASTVNISVTATAQRVELTVKDDGIGFQTEVSGDIDGRDGSGNGLRNIAARAENQGGHSTITSAPGSGTIVHWVIPVHGG